MLLSRLTLHANSDPINDAMIFDYIEAFPYRVSDINMSTDKTRFLCFLVSVCTFGKECICQTTCLARLLQEHNSRYNIYPIRTIIHSLRIIFFSKSTKEAIIT